MKKIINKVGLKRLSRYFFFSLWQGVFDLLTFSPLRVLWLKAFGASIGQSTIVDKIDFINLDRMGLKGFKVGPNCFLGRRSLYDLAGTITLKDWVVVSPKATILSHMSVGFKDHPLYQQYPSKVGHTKIDSGVFIGASATILSGVTIGQKSLIGAGAVVTKNVAPQKVAKGVPAKS